MAEREPNGVTANERWWAAARVALGTGQMVGGLTSLILVVQTGASAMAVGVVAVTGLLVLLSLVLFRGK